LGQLGGRAITDPSYQSSHPLPLVALSSLIPPGATLGTFFGQTRIDELMHHAKVASSTVTSAQLEEVVALNL
jgi:hypothetical protein